MNLLRFFLLVTCIALGALAARAQPQWRFHLAFEDGTGAKDTIWYVWDVTATEGSAFNPEVDYELGEGSIAMAPSSFNVWTGNWDGDSTKTIAKPYSTFPWHSSQPIDGMNYEYPITIRWDRSLFSASYLPDPDTINFAVLNGEYCYWFGDLPPMFQVCDLYHQDSLVIGPDAEWFPFFPTSFQIGHQDNPLSVDGLDADARVWRMDGERFWMMSGEGIEELTIHDMGGRMLHNVRPDNGPIEVYLGQWSPGLYVFHILSSNNLHHHGKFIKLGP